MADRAEAEEFDACHKRLEAIVKQHVFDELRDLDPSLAKNKLLGAAFVVVDKEGVSLIPLSLLPLPAFSP